MQYKRFGMIAAAAAAAALALSGCGSTGGETPASAATSTQPTATSSTTHNDADVTFATGMIPHHQQAVVMSDMVLAKQGIDPRVVTLANEIKAAQGPEIEQMQGWLTQWGAAATPAPSHNMPGHDMADMGGGPGMADMGSGHGMMSQADMTELQNAQGAEASRLFLTQMIEHHNGAITMAQTEIDSGQFPAAVEMARSIVASQQQEITTMQGILDSM